MTNSITAETDESLVGNLYKTCFCTSPLKLFNALFCAIMAFGDLGL